MTAESYIYLLIMCSKLEQVGTGFFYHNIDRTNFI